MKKCIICKSIRIQPLYHKIVKCQKCGHVFAYPYPSKKELQKHYNKDYFSGGEYSNYLKDKKVFQKNFKLRLKTLQKFISPVHHKHLLEIGCAYGFFLDLVRNQFKSVLGIDISKKGVSHARKQLKLKAIKADFLKYDFGGQKFDVICMWDTIEHLEKPHLFLEKIKKLTKKGSLIAITTGDIESLNARLRRRKWRLIHPTTHLHYFSKKTLSRLLANEGFEVIYNRYSGFYRSIDNIAYNIFILRHKWPWLYNLINKSGLGRINIYLNLYDIVYFIARRR